MRIAVWRLAGAAAAAAALTGADAAFAWGWGFGRAPEQQHVVKDPYFGVSLYDFFQERYFSSLTELMVAQHFGRVSHHEDEAEILRGGLYLSYGLHREAAEIFTRLIDKGAPPPIRDRAWFYLAKIRYQRGLLPEAEEAIGRVKDRLPGDLEEDRVLLHANLLMARGDYVGAAEVLKALANKGEAGLYARYNLGIALIKSGTVARGSEMLDEIGVLPATTEEYRSLRDKANVALGFAALQNQDPERAKVYLERVRLSGMLANKALLGFGWAADALHQPNDALVPWMELAERDASDAAVLEAKLAVPFALAEIGAYGQSLEQYGRAIAAFDQEGASLDASIAEIRAGKLLDSLLARNPGEEMGWFWKIDRLPDMPHAGQLAEVLALHEFQEAFKSYRDLQFLARNLRQWESSLDVIGDMLANRRQAFAERLPEVRGKERQLSIGKQEQRRDALAAELSGAEAAADGLAFADTREHEIDVRLDRVEAILHREPDDPELRVARERHRRVVGAMRWQLAQEYPGRVWDTKKDLRQLAAALTQARSQDAELAKAQIEEPLRFDQFGKRIAELRQRVQALMPRIDDLIDRQRAEVTQMAVAELEQQKDRLSVYTNQARFAVAQIYDRAALSRNAGHAPSSPAPGAPASAPASPPRDSAAPDAPR